MVKEEMPDLVDATDGFAHVSLTATGYATIPADWTDDASNWSAALEIIFGFSDDDTMTYKILIRDASDGMAVSVLSLEDDSEEVFAVAVNSVGDGSNVHEFRYEGRFPYGPWGDGSGYGSRHVRVLVSGDYTGEGGFSSIASAQGYEAGVYGSATAATSGEVSTFIANEDGIGTKVFTTSAAGAPSGAASEDGVAGINDYTYTDPQQRLKLS